MDNYENNKEIDMREITATVLMKWKKVLVLIIVFFLGLTSYQIIKTKKNNNTGDLSTVVSSLTDEEKNVVDDTFSQFQYYYTLYKNYSDKSNSFINLLNPYKTSILNINFAITTTISNPINYYQNLNLSQTQTSKLNELLNIDEQTSASDLISANISDQGNDTSNINIVSGTDERNLILNVQVIGVPQENSEASANIIADAVAAQSDLLNEKGYSTSVSEVSRTWEEGYSQKVADYQLDFDTQFGKIKEEYTALQDPSGFTDGEKAYYKVLVNDYLDVQAKSSHLVSLKKLIIFFLASIVIAIILFYIIEAIKSALSKTVKTERDLVLAGCGPVLGVVVTTSAKKQLFSKKIIQLTAPDFTSEDEVLKLASARILQQMKNQRATNLYICSDSNNNDASRVIKRLSALLGNQVTIHAGAPGCNTADYSNLVSSDAVLFIKSSGIDSDKNLIREVDITNRNNKSIIGNILIKKVY